jgi:hypothetical protein
MAPSWPTMAHEGPNMAPRWLKMEETNNEADGAPVLCVIFVRARIQQTTFSANTWKSPVQNGNPLIYKGECRP